MPVKISDPELQCKRCSGTGQVDEPIRGVGTFGSSKIPGVQGTCPDCDGTGKDFSKFDDDGNPKTDS